MNLVFLQQPSEEPDALADVVPTKIRVLDFSAVADFVGYPHPRKLCPDSEVFLIGFDPQKPLRG